MTGIPYGWITWAAATTAVGAAGSAEGFHTLASSFGPVAAGAVTVALSTRALLDLKAAYGPLTASAAPLLATGAGYLGGGHSTAPAAVSVALFVLAHSARKVHAS